MLYCFLYIVGWAVCRRLGCLDGIEMKFILTFFLYLLLSVRAPALGVGSQLIAELEHTFRRLYQFHFSRVSLSRRLMGKGLRYSAMVYQCITSYLIARSGVGKTTLYPCLVLCS